MSVHTFLNDTVCDWVDTLQEVHGTHSRMIFHLIQRCISCLSLSLSLSVCVCVRVCVSVKS